MGKGTLCSTPSRTELVTSESLTSPSIQSPLVDSRDFETKHQSKTRYTDLEVGP